MRVVGTLDDKWTMFLIEIKDDPIFCLPVHIYVCFVQTYKQKAASGFKKKLCKVCFTLPWHFPFLGVEGGPDVSQSLFLMALQVHN